MRNTKKESKQSLGMSFIEIIIGLAVMSVISLGIGTTMLQMNKSNRKIENKLEENDVLSGFSDYLKTEDFCSGALMGEKIDSKGRDIKTTNFNGAGVGVDIKKGDLSLNLRVDSLKAFLNDNVGEVETLYKGAPAKERIVDIVVKTSRKELGEKESKWVQSAEKRYSVPVKMQGGKVVSCNHLSSPESSCTAVGGVWTKKAPGSFYCKSTAKCESKGSYITWRCDNVIMPEHDHYCGESIRATIEDPSRLIPNVRKDGDIVEGAYKNSTNNKASCPPGSTAIITGMDSIYHEGLECGKKCTYKASQISYFYSCMKCDK